MTTGVVFLWFMGLMGPQGPEVAAHKARQAGHLGHAAVLLECLHNRPRRKRERWSTWNAKRMRIGYLAGHIALKRQRPKDAIFWLASLVKKPSQIRDYMAYLLAEAYLSANQPNKAIKLYKHILKEHGRHWRRPVRHKLLVAYRKARRWKDLAAHLKKLLWYPVPYGGRRSVLWQMVEAQLKAKNPKAVRKWLRHIPLRYPHTEEAKEAQMAAAKLARTPKEKASLLDWSRSEKLWRYYNMAYSHPTQAIDEIADWRKQLPQKTKSDRLLSAQLDMIKARALLRQRKYDPVVPLIKPLTSSRYPAAYRRRAIRLLGQAYIGNASFKAGWKLLHAYAEREPERSSARWAARWAALMAMLGQDYKRARRFFWEYLRIYPDMKPKRKRQYRWFHSWCLFRMGQYRKALREFKHLANTIRHNGLRRRIKYWTGRLHERTGRWDKARKAYTSLVRYVPFTYYGILAKRRLYLLEVQIRQQSTPATCMRKSPKAPKALYKTLAAQIKAEEDKEAKAKARKRKKRKKRRKRRKRRRKRKTKPNCLSPDAKCFKAQALRVALKNPLWEQKFSAPWQQGWLMMMQLEDNQRPSFKAQLDETMRDNVHISIKKSRKPVTFPPIPNYCRRRNTRHCKRARRAELLHQMGFQKAAVAELFRGRWVMKRPLKRLIHTIKWFRSVGAHHEAIRLTYWLRNWGKSFKQDEYLRLRYPPAHAPLLFKHTKGPKVPLAFAWAIMREESLFYQRTYSWAAARGLMQIIPRTAFRIAKIIGIREFSLPKLYAPNTNIRMGCWYLGQLLTKFEANIQLAAAAYNAGPHRVVAWLKARQNLAADEFSEEIPFDETRTYVRRVLRSFTVYNYLYRGSLPRPLSTVAVKIKDNINF